MEGVGQGLGIRWGDYEGIDSNEFSITSSSPNKQLHSSHGMIRCTFVGRGAGVVEDGNSDKLTTS